MAENNHGGRVGKIGISFGSSGIEIQREYISYRLIQELGLVKQCLAMERRDVLVKIDCEEIETSGTVSDGRLVVLEDFVEVIGSFRCDGSNLLVAASIARDKEDWNTLDLGVYLLGQQNQGGNSFLGVARTLTSFSMPCSRYKYREYLLAKRVCSVSKSSSLAYDGRM